MIPNGATLSVGSAFGAALAISAISNASPAVADLPADHGLTAGKLGILKVNWGRLLGKVAKGILDSILSYISQKAAVAKN